METYFYDICAIAALGGSENRSVWDVGRAGLEEPGRSGDHSSARVCSQQTTPSAIVVSGAGSTSCVELEPNIPNHHEVIEIRTQPRVAAREFLRIQWCVLAVEPGAEWTTGKSWSIAG